MNKLFSSLWILGIATLIVFPLLAWPIFYFLEISWSEVLSFEWNQIWSLLDFLSAGIIFGLIVIWFSELPYFEKALSRYKNLLSDFKIKPYHAVFLSICAGAGEEVFFRGALQPLFGIVITAIFFVAIHGYFSAKVLRVNFFALALTGFIILLGWGAREFTLWHAIAGHFSYDLVLLLYYAKMNR